MSDRVRGFGRERPPEPKRQFCTFFLGGHLCGVDILDVKEVYPEAVFTNVHHAPEHVRGFVNIRGQIHLVLDLRRILGMEPREVDGRTRLLLFKPSVGEAFGIVVDRIGDVVEVEEKLIESGRLADDAPALGGDAQGEGMEIVSGVCRLEATLLLIINARELLRTVGKPG